MKSIIFLFVDGIGLEHAGPHNPFSNLNLDGFNQFSDGKPWVPITPDVARAHGREYHFSGIDATLGLEGLPQSGTCQASLFTGINCALAAGKHFGPFPHSSSHEIIARTNLFTEARDKGISCSFVNAYPDEYFKRSKASDRWSVTTRCCLDAGVRLRSLGDLADGTALAADITGEGLLNHWPTVRRVSEQQAALRLHSLSLDYSLCVFEYFLTDKAGHTMSATLAERILLSLNSFIVELCMLAGSNGTSILITSDHGNLEDLSIKTHTRNQVPLACYGPASGFFRDCESITDVMPALLTALTNKY